MAYVNDTKEILWQNLIDSGCDDRMIASCMALAENESEAALLPLLTRHRTALRESVRAGQKSIDALDYLIFRIQKQSANS